MGGISFGLHGKIRVIRTTWDTILIDGIVLAFETGTVKRDIRFLKTPVSAKGIAGQQGSVNINGAFP